VTICERQADEKCHYFRVELADSTVSSHQRAQNGLAWGLLYINHPNPFRFLPEGATP
jgi:hypothetical protein